LVSSCFVCPLKDLVGYRLGGWFGFTQIKKIQKNKAYLCEDEKTLLKTWGVSMQVVMCIQGGM
jgi:hypothetical protein